jgi:type I restriction enzyme S subunit
MRAGWRSLAFREFLAPNSRPYLLGSAEDANLVGMRLYGEGPFHRECKPAIRIAKKSHFRIKAGDIIYNKLFAWKGTFGLVTAALDGMLVSDKFPTYELDRMKVSERFLTWYFRYPPLWEQAREKSTGSAALSKLTLNPPRFLDLILCAPEELGEQEAIADRLDEQAARIAEVRSLKLATEVEIGAMSRVIISDVMGDVAADGQLALVLSEKPRNGWSPKCDNTDDGVAVLSLTAVTGFQYKPTAFKRTTLPTERDAHYWLRPNDLLMSRSNTLELVGHAAIYSGEPQPCIYPDLLMRLHVNEIRALKRFVWYWLQTKASRAFVESKAKGTSPTMKKISQGVVCAIPFPKDLSLDRQRQKIAQLDTLLGTIATIAEASRSWEIGVNALVPALLEKELGSSGNRLVASAQFAGMLS